MANALVDLTTLESAKAHLTSAGVSLPTDEVLGKLITEVSTHIQGYLGRCLPLQAHSQRFSGHGGDTVMVPHYPIASVQQVRVSGQSIQAALSDVAPGYIADGWLISLRGDLFERGVQNCLVEYTAGFSPLPADITRAANEAIRAGLQAFTNDAGGQAVAVKAGNTSITFGDVESVASLCVTPAITSALDLYRRVAPC